MENRLVACCGLDCSQCPAYIATQANDVATLEEMVAPACTQPARPGLARGTARRLVATPLDRGYVALTRRVDGIEVLAVHRSRSHVLGMLVGAPPARRESLRRTKPRRVACV